jgi:hypothetical protein
VLSALPRGVRQRIAEQVEQDDGMGAAKTLRGALNIGWWRSQEVIGGLPRSASRTTLASGKIDKGGTTLTLYRDGTFTTMGLFSTSKPDRLVAFSSDIDSMRRKSTTGRGAAALATGGMSLNAPGVSAHGWPSGP